MRFAIAVLLVSSLAFLAVAATMDLGSAASTEVAAIDLAREPERTAAAERRSAEGAKANGGQASPTKRTTEPTRARASKGPTAKGKRGRRTERSAAAPARPRLPTTATSSDGAIASRDDRATPAPVPAPVPAGDGDVERVAPGPSGDDEADDPDDDDDDDHDDGDD